jgi:endonuclease/exonuclease/phosphatase family metal-dependent hydrolase
MAYCAAFISPAGSFWWLQLIGLGYGFLLAVNVVFVIFWLLLRKKIFLLSLFVILIGGGRIFNIFQFHSKPKPESVTGKAEQASLKVMSFNVRLFDLYNWFHNYETRQRIFDFLKKESPDVVCFQEYFHSEHNELHAQNNDTLLKVLNVLYSHIEYNVTLHNDDHWGIATFSKYPIIHKRAVNFRKSGGNLFIYSDIVAGNDTLRVVNVHLQSIHFKAQDYKFIENINNDVKQDELAGSMRILQSMKRAYTRRAEQVDLVKDSMNNSPYPVILCGDFNDTPSSYSYHKMSEGFKDAFRESGSGFGKTYAGLFPSFRIDYILHDKRLKSTGYITYHEKLSDHYPISCLIKIKDENRQK